MTAGETWTFSAAGSWTDWWITCGPEGYRNFLADILSIRPRVPDVRWFCLCGRIDSDGEPFAIGRGCSIRAETSGRLVVFANDRPAKYANNRGAIELTAMRGGISASDEESDPRGYSGLTGAWRLLSRRLAETRGLVTVAFLVIGACLMLAVMTQGQDLVRTIGEDGLSRAPVQSIMLAATLLFLAIQTWLWPRLLIESNYGRDRKYWRPRRLFEWTPRILAIAPILLTAYALADGNAGFALVLVLLAGALLAALIFRQDALHAVRKRLRPGETDRSIPFARWWILASFAGAIILMVYACYDPVGMGRYLGAPAVVFLGLGLIISPLIVVIQFGQGLRLPIIGIALIVAVLMSTVRDDHVVGWRAFGKASLALKPSARLTLEQAYDAWYEQQSSLPGQPVLILLVASQGGASRAGDWTGEVLAALHEKSGGRLAKSLFAISSVSGGSVGAVGYVSKLRSDPAGVATLTAFTGADALSPALTSMLFPDLFKRFIPLPLPDRAEGLERAWEAGWDSACPARSVGCRGLMQRPFLALAPSVGQPWSPILVINGASEESGRRILTSTVDLGSAVDAEDFHATVKQDVAVSTAIDNGARFPWISPPGVLSTPDGSKGHIVDGGYFDASGVATLSEIGRRIASIAARKGQRLRFVFVFIGYDGAMSEEKPTKPVGLAPSKIAAMPKSTPARNTPPLDEKPSKPPLLANDVMGPLYAMFTSMLGHQDHIFQRFKYADPLPGNFEATLVPIMLCNSKIDQKPFVPPMNWALSEKARDFIHDALEQCWSKVGSRNAEGIRSVTSLLNPHS